MGDYILMLLAVVFVSFSIGFWSVRRSHFPIFPPIEKAKTEARIEGKK